MKRLFGVVFLLFIVIACLGFYRGWFHFSTDGTEQKPSATITVDKDKIRADEVQVKVKVEGFGQKVKEKTGDRTGKVTEQERRP